MADIQHKDITEGQLHEPKGVSTAVQGTTYVADGIGSGSWAVPKISGQSSAAIGTIPYSTGGGNLSWDIVQISGQDTATLNQVPYSDGSGDITWASIKTTSGVMDITNNATSVGITAAVTTDLSSNSDYSKILYYALDSGISNDLSFDSTNKGLIASSDGTWKVSGYVTVSHSVALTEVGIKIAVDDSLQAKRCVGVVSNASGLTTIPVSQNLTLSSDDVVSIYMASTNTGNITIVDSSVSLELIKEL